MSPLKRIVAELGGTLLDDGRRALIPGPGHGPNDRSVSLACGEDGRILIHCFSPRDDWRAVRRLLISRQLLNGAGAFDNAKESEASPDIQPCVEDRAARARRLWNEARPLAWSAAELYLRGRAITRPAWNDEALRFHPRMTSLHDRTRRPALIAALRDDDGAVQGVQATLLTAHGAAKAPIATPRRTIGALMGGAVRLDPPNATLIVAEGVETALSAAAALGHAAWALLSAINLARFSPPAFVEHLLIACDNDQAGLEAAERLSLRLHGTVETSLRLPPDAHNDWNDWARANAALS
jgi:phage/plasmid primase-like uncharacterized protein